MTRRRRVRHGTVEHEPDCPAGPPPITSVAEANALAGGLLRALSPLAGDPAGVDQTMREWLAEHDVSRFGFIALAAVRTVFVQCLTRVAEVPPGSLGFTIQEDPDDDRR